MNFRFETDYDLDTLTAMAKGIRRTVRKKRSRRVHVFTAITFLLCACGLLAGLLSREPFDARDAVTLLAILTGLVTGLLEDRLNARAAKARLLPGTEHAATVFDEDGYTMTTGVTETRWQYAQILAIAETKRYFILALSHTQRGNQQGRSHAKKYIFNICHACTAFPVAGSSANRLPVSRKSNQQ